jgi:hypothetical protein
MWSSRSSTSGFDQPAQDSRLDFADVFGFDQAFERDYPWRRAVSSHRKRSKHPTLPATPHAA